LPVHLMQPNASSYRLCGVPYVEKLWYKNGATEMCDSMLRFRDDSMCAICLVFQNYAAVVVCFVRYAH